LAWTDAPGATVGAAYVNDLNLTVEINGQSYLGNVFSGATSIPGGASDPRNNVESVLLPAGVDGSFSFTVAAANIAGDGVPGNDDDTDQDFALICYNCTLTPNFMLHIAPPTQSLCAGTNAFFTLPTTSISGFTHPLALETTGAPDGVDVVIQPNPLIPGETAQMTLPNDCNARRDLSFDRHRQHAHPYPHCPRGLHRLHSHDRSRRVVDARRRADDDVHLAYVCLERTFPGAAV
jgi:hypothetical protein